MNPEHPRHSKAPPPFWLSRTGLAFLGFLAIAGFFLLTEHRAHVLGALPFVLLALCPLLPLFGHSDHGHTLGAKNRPGYGLPIRSPSWEKHKFAASKITHKAANLWFRSHRLGW